MPMQKDFWEDAPMFNNPWEDPPMDFLPPVNVVGEPEPPMEPMPYPTMPQLPPMSPSPFDGMDTNAIIQLLQRGGSGAISVLQRILGGGGGGGSSGANGNPMDFIMRLINGGQGMGNGILENPMLIPSLVSAMNQWKDSDRYMERSEEWAQQADPFGRERAGYQDRLRGLMTDPENYLKNDPAYQSQLRLAMNPVQSKMRARGYGNSGNMLSELTRVSSDTTNKYINELRDDLGNFSGAQFGPDTAARLRQGGLDASVRSRNAALDALMYPFAATAFNQQGKPPGGGTGSQGGLPPWLTDLFRSGGTSSEGPGGFVPPQPSPANNGSGEDNVDDRYGYYGNGYPQPYNPNTNPFE